jgi:hypothetical protein
MSRNVTSGLARPVDFDHLPDDRHLAHLLRKLERSVPPPSQPIPLELERESPVQYRVQFSLRKPRPFWRLMLDYFTRPYP